MTDRWRLLFDNMTVGFALHEVIRDAAGRVIDYRFLQINPAYESLTGLRAAVMVGKRLLDMMPDTESYWIEVFGKVATTGEPIDYENFSGELGRWYHVRAFCPEPDQFAVMVSDVTRTKGAEQELKASLAYSQALIQSVTDGFVVADLYGKLVDVNPAICNMTGFSREELIGASPPYPYFTAQAYDDVMTAMPQIQAATIEKPFSMETQFRTRDGREFPVLISPSRVRDADGNALYLLGTIKDISERKTFEDEIVRLGLYDHLTRLPNRRLLAQNLAKALAASQRRELHGAVMFIDLDHFKQLNDSRGHETGDDLLMATARRLQSLLRENDTVARIGGDEFVVVLEDLDRDVEIAKRQAEQVAEKLRCAMTGRFDLACHTEFVTSASIGVTLFRDQRHSPEDLMKQADLAMYQAKAAGRNAVRFFDAKMQVGIDRRLTLEQAMRRGLARGEFELFYQPQVDFSGRIFGAEALIRWRDPERGFVSPAEFIPIAEENGFITDLGAWVLDSACAQLARWRADPALAHIDMAINVSARQFRHGGFFDGVRHALAEHGAQSRQLKLELTESTIIDANDNVLSAMRELSGLGVQFELDDFGTGYSSLAYLKRLPLHRIKIDQTFVRDIGSDANDAAIVSAIVAMSKSLGLDVIAEGVETMEQVSFLMESGCSKFQGYLFGKPAPASCWLR